MIKINIQDLMWQKKIKSVSDLARNAGVSRQTIDALYNRSGKIKGIQFDTLDRLCRALGCRVEDLIQYIPDERMAQQPRIEVVREDDPDYEVFLELADEPDTSLEECDDLFERLDLMRRQRDHQD